MRTLRSFILATLATLVVAGSALAGDCRPPDQDPPIFEPAGRIGPACGDPWHRATFDNSDSNVSGIFVFKVRRPDGTVHRTVRTVAAGATLLTDYRHAKPGSWMTVRAKPSSAPLLATPELLATRRAPTTWSHHVCPA